jgi:hypothetical protein
MKPILTALMILMAQSVSLCHANKLTYGNFDTPDNEWWADSGWTSWGLGGRMRWAARGDGGRGVAAYGGEATNELGFYQNVPATSGVTYTFTIWVRKEINYNEEHTELKLEWKDSHYADLGGTFITNISSQAGPTFTKFTLSGSTINPACAYVRPIVFTRWLTPTNDQMTTMQLDDASLEVESAAVIEISQLPWLAFGIMFLAPMGGVNLRKIRRIPLPK